jgi:hypothetical protein
MKAMRVSLLVGVVSLFCGLCLQAQQQAVSQTSSAQAPTSVVPPLVRFSGVLKDETNRPLSGTVGIAGVTFAIYKNQYEGAPLWLEIQNVQADAKGKYTVQLGATKPEGLPLDLFSSGEARWLGVRVNGGEEQPRVVLVSVPYALKALDAETLGGRPASAFMVVPPSGSKGSQLGPLAEQANEIVCLSGTACATGFVPLFSSNGGSAKVNDSIITQSGTTVGIAGSVSANGNVNVTGLIGLPNTSNATTGVITLGGSPFAHNFGTSNTFVGHGAGNFGLSGDSNTATGVNTLVLNTTGNSNTVSGLNALFHNTTGSRNTASGVSALVFNTTGNENTSSGEGSLFHNTTGSDNTASGFNALFSNTTGNFNTALGVNAGHTTNNASTTGTNNTFIGAFSGPGTQTKLSNATAIGANALVVASNSMVLGDGTINVGIDTTSGVPMATFDVVGQTVNNIPVARLFAALNQDIILGLGNVNGPVHVFRVNSVGKVFADGGFQTGGADFAESFAVRGGRTRYEAGDLLVIDRSGTRRMALAHHPYSHLVAGIYSTKPGLLGTVHTMFDPEIEQEVPLAVVGVVPCKVTAENGSIAPGDLLVSSSRPGFAMKGTNRKRMLGAVVGKALEPLLSGKGTIIVLVTLQ